MLILFSGCTNHRVEKNGGFLPFFEESMSLFSKECQKNEESAEKNHGNKKT